MSLTSIIINIQKLVNVREQNSLLFGKEMALLPCIDNAFILIEDGIIACYGAMFELELKVPVLPGNIIDGADYFILPAWCDSHTHIVFAASREGEFIDKIKGVSYAEIAAKGGGILNSAQKLVDTSEEALFELAYKRLIEISRSGTGALEIKSGYGLSVEGELKMLRVIKRLKEQSDLSIKATFLGAHTYPLQFKEDHSKYIDSIVNEMLPTIAKENLADFIDVFCEKNFFSPEEMERICLAGKQYGLKPKLHINQLNSIGGVKKGLALQAVSLDHLETLTSEDIDLLSDHSKIMPDKNRHQTICTLLPTAAFFLRMNFPHIIIFH